MNRSAKERTLSNKSNLERLLKENRLDELVLLAVKNKRVISTLISLTYDKQNVIAWRAIEVIGSATGNIARTSPDFVRSLIGRLLWMIRDESGGIGWSSPEILSEIVRNSPDLFPDIIPVIVSFLDEKMLIKGVLFGISRMAGEVRKAVPDISNRIVPFFKDHDPSVRGYAAFAFAKAGSPEDMHMLQSLLTDDSNIFLYDQGDFRERRVSEIASKALRRTLQ